MFSLAERFMGRQNLFGKFAVVGALLTLLIAVLVVQMVRNFWDARAFAVAEQQGLPPLRKLMPLLDSAQRHRGLSTTVASGKSELSAKAQEGAVEVQRQIDELKIIAQATPWLAASATRLGQAWVKSQSVGGDQGGPKRFEAGSQFVDAVLYEVRGALEASGLILDPESVTYHLMSAAYLAVPETIESLARLRGQTAGFLADGAMSPEEIALTLRNTQVVLRQWALSQEALSYAGEGVSASLSDETQKLNEAMQALSASVRGEVAVESPTVNSATWFESVSKLIESNYGLTATITEQLDRELTARIDGHTQSATVLALVTVMLFVVVAWLSAGSYLGMQHNLSEVQRVTHAYSEGDLRAVASIKSRDEFGEILRSVNSIGQALTTLVADIHKGAEAVAIESSALTRAGQEILRGASAQSEAASAMAASIEEMTVSISQVADNSRDAQKISQEGGHLSQQGNAVVQAAVTQMQGIAAGAHQLQSIVETLGQQSGQIGRIVQVIHEVASQTNLLALNAAIEAARAGEQGRGFSVVADEVRKLAERTTESTQEIGQMVNAIQEGTRNAVKYMDGWRANVDEGMAKARDAGANMASVADGSERIVGVVDEMSGALREQSSAANEVSRRVEAIAQMADENSRAIQQVAQTTSTLEGLSEHLRATVGRFRLA